MSRLLVVCFLLGIFCECNSFKVGSTCNHKRDGRDVPGNCTLLRNCAEANKLFTKHNIVPQLCKPNSRIVCCALPDKNDGVRPIFNTISAQKCQEYALEKKDVCGISAASLIVNGEEANDREFPHMALIGYKKSGSDDFLYKCGGSLISRNFVLSAGHCAYSSDLKQAEFVKLGDVRRGDNNPNTFLYHIGSRIKHPKHTVNSIDYDIALFKLNKTVVLNSYVRPICLPQMDEEVHCAVVTGWGITEYASALSKKLMKVSLDIFNETDCQSNYDRSGMTSNGIDYATKICAGSYKDEKDSCNGDSGGPLQISNRDKVYCMYTVIGVVSYGHAKCGTKGVPGVYTRVFPYLKWIESIVWPGII